MKSKTIFKAESNAENFLSVIFFGLAIYFFIQIILMIIDYFYRIDINSTIAALM
jgi:preprotein translocase subunit SecG